MTAPVDTAGPGYAPQGGGYQPGFAPQQTPGHGAPSPGTAPKATFGAALRSEWTKIRSVRSTFWTLLLTMAVTIGLSALFAFGSVQNHGGGNPDKDYVANSLFGLFLGQLVIVVFGAMAITAEYSTGMIRTSLTSQPRRAVVFWSKTLIVALVSLAVGLICSFASFFIGSAIFSSHGVHVSLADGSTLRAVIGGGLYLAGSALLAFGLGAILRHTAGAITTAVGMLFVAWIVVSFLPGSWRDDIGKWIPFNAGMQIITTKPMTDGNYLSPWAGFAVFSLYAVVAIIGGAVTMRKRDA